MVARTCLCVTLYVHCQSCVLPSYLQQLPKQCAGVTFPRLVQVLPLQDLLDVPLLVKPVLLHHCRNGGVLKEVT